MPVAAYPTVAHERAAVEITRFFAERTDAEAVLLTNSCARAKATPDSCLVSRLCAEWLPYYDESLRVKRLAAARLYCLLGGSGNDTFYAKDGVRDTVNGGPGSDIAVVDPKLDRLISIEKHNKK